MKVLAYVIDHLPSILASVASLVAALASYKNKTKIEELHVMVNGRMDQLIDQTSKTSLLQGAKNQRQEDKDNEDD
jgi:hypothetical protein